MTVPDDAFSQFEYAGWQRVAGRYEDAWSGLTRLFIPSLLDAVGVTAGMRLLDVACGPGYVAEAASARGAIPVGLDFSPAMVRLAQARNPEIEFHLGDAQRLPFETRTFDAVVMNFGLLHLASPAAAFAEAARVLRPRGAYGFSVWAGPAHSPGARVVEEAIERHADKTVALPSGPAYFACENPDDCRQVLQGLGFDPTTLVFRTVTAVWQVPTAGFVFAAERDAGVRTAALLAAQRPEALSAIESCLIEEFKPYAQPRGLGIPYGAHVIGVHATA